MSLGSYIVREDQYMSVTDIMAKLFESQADGPEFQPVNVMD